jgi:hypothetical protein
VRPEPRAPFGNPDRDERTAHRKARSKNDFFLEGNPSLDLPCNLARSRSGRVAPPRSGAEPVRPGGRCGRTIALKQSPLRATLSDTEGRGVSRAQAERENRRGRDSQMQNPIHNRNNGDFVRNRQRRVQPHAGNSAPWRPGGRNSPARPRRDLAPSLAVLSSSRAVADLALGNVERVGRD